MEALLLVLFLVLISLCVATLVVAFLAMAKAEKARTAAEANAATNRKTSIDIEKLGQDLIGNGHLTTELAVIVLDAKKKMEEVHKTTDGLVDKLVQAVGGRRFAEGQLAERAKEAGKQ